MYTQFNVLHLGSEDRHIANSFTSSLAIFFRPIFSFLNVCTGEKSPFPILRPVWATFLSKKFRHFVFLPKLFKIMNKNRFFSTEKFSRETEDRYVEIGFTFGRGLIFGHNLHFVKIFACQLF